MLQVSQEQGSTPADYSDMYVYDATAGAGSTVYVVDTGANIANTVRRVASLDYIHAKRKL
jgi:hypothetical protein